jgi:hypothetical protein
MADKWIHKEELWRNPLNGVHPAESNFTEWLDERCTDGWEVLKISRDFQNPKHVTWVVFRKQV